jgi:hypothetical protein
MEVDHPNTLNPRSAKRSNNVIRGQFGFPVAINQYEVALLLVVLAVSAIVRLPGMVNRPIWYDEAITLYKTTHHFPPVWSTSPTPVHKAKAQLEGTPGADTMGYRTLSPYFRLLFQWRQWFGWSLETARAFSLIWSLGTIILLYLFLRAGAIPYPLIPTLVYALSSGAVDYGHEARAYAFAGFLVTGSALCAYQAVKWAADNARRSAVYAAVMAAGWAIAVPAHYLTLFPIGITLVWFLACLWPVYRRAVIVASLAAVGVGLLGFFMINIHVPVNFRGNVDLLSEFKALLKSNLGILWVPKFVSSSHSRELTGWMFGGLSVAYGGWVALIGTTLVHVLRQWPAMNRKFWLLIFALACAPTLGALLTDFLLDAHLHRRRYVLFAGPALALMVSYGITRLMTVQWRWGIGVLAGLLALQMTGIYWGPSSRADDRWARWAHAIQQRVSPSHVVAVVGYWPHQGALIHELNALAPDTQVVSVERDSDLAAVSAVIQLYEDVWIAIYPTGHHSGEIAQRLRDQLTQSGQYKELWRNSESIHLRQLHFPKRVEEPRQV